MFLSQRNCSFFLAVVVVLSFFHSQIVVGLTSMVLIMILPQISTFNLKLPYLFFLLVPVVVSFFAGLNNILYDVLKDVYYFLIPVIFFVFASLLTNIIPPRSFFRLIVFGGAVISLLMTTISVSSLGLSAFANPYAGRYAIGIVGNPTPVLALAVLAFTRKYRFNIVSRPAYWPLVGLNLLGFYMFASRTYLLILILFGLFLFLDRKRSIVVLPISLFVGLLVVSTFSVDSSAGGADSFLGKLSNSFSEVKIDKYETEEDINTKYRGYESFMALKGYQEGDLKDWFLGGFGKLVDLKIYANVGGANGMRFIPILHNGFVHLLIKSGLVGVICYLIFFCGIVKRAWSGYVDPQSRTSTKLVTSLLIGSVLSLIATHYVVRSIFNVEMTILMLFLGYLNSFHAHITSVNSPLKTP